MSDAKEKTSAGEPQRERPNANYQLSKQNPGKDELVFYYNRERRLAKAPQAVKDLYREEKPKRFGFLAPLLGSKPRAMMFGSIVLICVTMLILSVLGYTSDSYDLEGNQVAVQAIRYEGTVIVALKKTVKKNALFRSAGAYAGAVNIAAFPAKANSGQDPSPSDELTEVPPVFIHRLFFTLEPQEDYRFAVPFDAEALALVLQTEKKTLSITIRAK